MCPRRTGQPGRADRAGAIGGLAPALVVFHGTFVAGGGGEPVKRIGLLGGMSWESSVEYERVINREVQRRCGGVASADLVVRSLDFSVVEKLQATDRWTDAGELLAAEAALLERAGCEIIVLCTNTMHRVADAIEAAIGVSFIHIADATADAVRAAGITTVGLLGTRYTMEADFYAGRLRDRHGLDVVVPPADQRDVVHRIIYDELVRGVVNDASRAQMLTVIDGLRQRGATGVIAGCTEIELLVRPHDVDGVYFPTAELHARAAVDAALASEG
jgi:aspartate racemase